MPQYDVTFLNLGEVADEFTVWARDDREAEDRAIELVTGGVSYDDLTITLSDRQPNPHGY